MPVIAVIFVPVVAVGFFGAISGFSFVFLIFASFVPGMSHLDSDRNFHLGPAPITATVDNGTITFTNGEYYTGTLKNGVPDGKKGIYIFTNGDAYIGVWKDGKQNGSGSYKYADGSWYMGYWKDGKMHGDGSVTSANGVTVSGEWVDGVQVK
jgi:hypothetical protein